MSHKIWDFCEQLYVIFFYSSISFFRFIFGMILYDDCSSWSGSNLIAKPEMLSNIRLMLIAIDFIFPSKFHSSLALAQFSDSLGWINFCWLNIGSHPEIFYQISRWLVFFYLLTHWIIGYFGSLSGLTADSSADSFSIY
jgi:hypothetical protein